VSAAREPTVVTAELLVASGRVIAVREPAVVTSELPAAANAAAHSSGERTAGATLGQASVDVARPADAVARIVVSGLEVQHVSGRHPAMPIRDR
jgi:hypothetical protein